MLPFYFRLSAPALGIVLLAGCAPRSSLREPLPSVTPIASAEFRQAIGALVGPGFQPGNKIETLSNGREIFPAMLAAIRGAKRSINFETYVFYNGEVPQAFAEAFAERARAGVKVNVIFDAHGSSKSRRYHDDLRRAGVQLEIYNSIYWWDIRRYNFRTHRKLLVVDGKLGFIGGVGIADEWDGDARNPEEWRDLHFRVQGPIVAQLQAAFNDNWFEIRGEILQGNEYFPPLAPAGTIRASVFPSAPKQSEFSVELMYHLVIASARRSILIENAYFLPDDALVDALCAAAERGVRVQIIMPGEHMDQKAVRRASRKRWPRLIKSGVQLYEFEPTMIHTKLLIADGLFVSLGSANFDPRSLRINDEANLDALDTGFAAEMTQIFRQDLARSRPVELDGNKIKKLPEAPVQAAQAPVESQL